LIDHLYIFMNLMNSFFLLTCSVVAKVVPLFDEQKYKIIQEKHTNELFFRVFSLTLHAKK